jgi:hypothetical protein
MRVWKGIALRGDPEESTEDKNGSAYSARVTDSVTPQNTCKTQQYQESVTEFDAVFDNFTMNPSHEGGFTNNPSHSVTAPQTVTEQTTDREDYEAMVVAEDRAADALEECHHGVLGGCHLCRKQGRFPVGRRS